MGALNIIQLPSLHLATFSSISPSFSQSPLKTLTPTRRSITRTSSLKSFLDLTPEYKPQSLNIDLERHDFTGGSPDYDAVIIGCGPSGLHLASLASKHGLHICCVDPSPLLLWPNNYGVWVDEFEAMNLTDTLDKVWPSATVIINDQKSKHLDRPYGRVNRNYLKSKLIQACVSNGVKFHVAKAWKVEHQVSRPSPRAGPADRPAASNGAGPHWVQGLRLDLVRVNLTNRTGTVKQNYK